MCCQSARVLELETSLLEICISSCQSCSFSWFWLKGKEQGLNFRKAQLVHWSTCRKRWGYPFIAKYWCILSNSPFLKGLRRPLEKPWSSCGCWKLKLSLVESMSILRVGWEEGPSSLSLYIKVSQEVRGCSFGPTGAASSHQRTAEPGETNVGQA